MTTRLSNSNSASSNATPQFPAKVPMRKGTADRLSTSNAALPGVALANYNSLTMPSTSVAGGIWWTGPLDPHSVWDISIFGTGADNATGSFALYGVFEVVDTEGHVEYQADLLYEATLLLGQSVPATPATLSTIFPAACRWADTITLVTDGSLGGATIRNLAQGRARVTGDGEGYIGYIVVTSRTTATALGYQLRTF